MFRLKFICLHQTSVHHLLKVTGMAIKNNGNDNLNQSFSNILMIEAWIYRPKITTITQGLVSYQ
jgi:cystathionine beta-lyase family protein involved in aluminum resistance